MRRRFLRYNNGNCKFNMIGNGIGTDILIFDTSGNFAGNIRDNFATIRDSTYSTLITALSAWVVSKYITLPDGVLYKTWVVGTPYPVFGPDVEL